MKTRPATVADAAAIRAVHMRCLTAAVSDFTPLGRRIVERFYRNALARGLCAVLVAEEEGRTAGFVMVTRDVRALFTKSLLDGAGDVVAFVLGANPAGLVRAAWSKLSSRTAAIPAVPELVYLAVDAPFRGRGGGASLMDAAEAWFRQQGIGTYELNVRASNQPALDLYLGKGMEIARSYVKNGAAMHTLRKRL